ncbi:MAG: hypothetical protein AAFR75_01955 [Pseudomonadota bacterium]
MIESAAVGEATALFNARSGAIVTTDALGAVVIGHLKRGVDPVGVAAAIATTYGLTASEGTGALQAVVEDLAAQWDEAGLLADNRLEFPDPVTDHGNPVLYNAEYQTRFGKFRIASETRLLADQLDEILGTVSKGRDTPSQDHRSLRCVSCSGGGFGVFSGEALWGRSTLDEARFLIIREAAEVLCGTDRVGAVMHGSAVSNGGGAMLIMGDSGRGKSTLAQGLVAAGCGYVSDDHLPLHVGGGSVLSFPTRSAVKPRAMRLAEIKRLTRRYGTSSRARDGVTYLSIPAVAEPGEEVPVSALVFPQYKKGASLALTRLTPQEAFGESIIAGARPARINPQIGPLARLCGNVPAFRLDFGASTQSVPACLEILEDCKT